jgi:hypothetical protein
VRNHLSEGTRLAALLHSKMAKELAMLRAMVSSTMESVHGRSPNDAFRVEVVGELAAEFQKIEDRRSRLSSLPLGSVTSSLGHCSVELDWLVI